MKDERLNSRLKICPAVCCLLLLLLPVFAEAGHFPAPIPTDKAAYFLGSFKINGLPAKPGDEVAFFDPQGILCGLHVVVVSGQYGRVSVYSDDASTPSIDEGASPGDTLTVKIWDSTAGIELEGSALNLAQGFYGGSSTPSLIPPKWQADIDYALDIGTATHFPKPDPSMYSGSSIFWGNLIIKGQLPGIGDEIGVFDASGTAIGHFLVTTPDKYGFMSVYGNSSTHSGKPLTFKIWDKSAAIEYAMNNLILKQGTPTGSFIASPLPPVWTDNASYALDVEVPLGDVVLVTLRVVKSGAGAGTIAATYPVSTINCDTNCSESSWSYYTGETVILSAVADASSTFTGWSGDCSGYDATCSVTMDASRNVIATFAVNTHTLTLTKSGTGGGTVTGNPSGISCGSTCSSPYTHGTSVTLTAAADANSTFTGWSGDCSGNTDTATVIMDSDKACNAEFTAVSGYSSISLNAGWNFISIPEQPADSAIEHVLADISSDVRVVWGYDNETKQWLRWNPSTLCPSPSALCSIESGKGYWIYVYAPVTLAFVTHGSSPQPLTLYEGWNLVGYSGQNNAGAQPSLSALSDKWTIAWNWDRQAWRFIKNATPALVPSIFTDAPLRTFKKGKAYWLKMNSATTWQQ